VILLLAAALATADPLPPPAEPKPRVGWELMPASLVLRGPEGEVREEWGLGEFQEDADAGLTAKTTLKGGTNPDGRFAWKWRKRETVRTGREDRSIGSTVSLSYLGSDGQTLWESDAADSPSGMAPLLQSRDGETALMITRSASGWRLAAMTYAGLRLAQLQAAQRLERVHLTENGLFALALWGERDRPLVYTLLDIKHGLRKDLPASDWPLGIARVEEDGTALSGKAVAHKFP
jgi:hypothetical protein